METRIILIVGSILFCGGCIGLLIVRLSNPFLKGLSFLGGAYAAGALGAAILALGDGRFVNAFVFTANTLVLLAYILLHICIQQAMESEVRPPRLGAALLFLQFIAFAVAYHLHQVRQFSVIVLGVFIALQALQTAVFLKRTPRPGMLAPSWLGIVILVAFAAFNLFRSAVILILGTSQDPNVPNPYQLTSVIVFIGAGLGIGFTVFWISSSQIRLMLEQLANTDPLTGIYNRRSFINFCDREILRCSRNGEPLSLVILDVDHFKQINDRYGHSFGDTVLRAVVEKLRDSVRNVDVVGRWGGEEFVALLPGADPHAAQLVAQRIRHKVESLTLKRTSAKTSSAHSADTRIPVTISLGVATYLGPHDNLDSLIDRCDKAMYQAKAEGRNRVV